MIEGELLHRDSLGSEQIIRAGQVNLMTAGHGIVHSEDQVADGGPLHALHAAQMWIALPDTERDRAPAFQHYPQLPVALRDGVTVTVLVGEALGLPPTWFWPSFLLLVGLELLVPAWAERASPTPWHPHHIAERYALMVIITLGECVLGAANAVANLWRAGTGWSAGWGYGHYVVFAAVAAVGSGLEVVADTLKPADGAAHAVPEAVLVAAIGLLQWHASRPSASGAPLVLGCLACIAAVPPAVALGLPLPWGLFALSLGPCVAIIGKERGRPSVAGHAAGAG